MKVSAVNCQKLLITHGTNEKAYIAGTLDARDGTVLWMGDTLKNSSLFIKMLRKLDSHYAAANRIHVIVDNYGIHKSAETKAALADMRRDLHDNVTRNHQHGTLEDPYSPCVVAG